MTKQDQDNILIAKIVGPHSLSGSVRVLVYSDNPEQLQRYKVLKASNGKAFTIKKARHLKGDMLVVKFEEISDRLEAEAARGIDLYVPRSQMPELEEDEFYINDLVGLKVRSLSGEEIGVVKNVENHGAGDFLTIDPFLTVAVPFTLAAVPEVHARDGYIVLDESFLTLSESESESEPEPEPE